MKKQNTWLLLVLSILLGPVMIFYWAFEYLRGLLEPGAHKSIRIVGIADIGIGLSIASCAMWFIMLTNIA